MLEAAPCVITGPRTPEWLGGVFWVFVSFFTDISATCLGSDVVCGQS